MESLVHAMLNNALAATALAFVVAGASNAFNVRPGSIERTRSRGKVLSRWAVPEGRAWARS